MGKKTSDSYDRVTKLRDLVNWSFRTNATEVLNENQLQVHSGSVGRDQFRRLEIVAGEYFPNMSYFVESDGDRFVITGFNVGAEYRHTNATGEVVECLHLAGHITPEDAVYFCGGPAQLNTVEPSDFTFGQIKVRLFDVASGSEKIASQGDWIVLYAGGEIDVLKDSEFQNAYTPYRIPEIPERSIWDEVY